MARKRAGGDPPGTGRRAGGDPRAPDPAVVARLEQVRRLAAQGRTSDALALCRRLNQDVPHQPAILGLLGMLYTRSGALAQALEQLAGALLLAPSDPTVLYHLAQVYLQAGAPVHALHSLHHYHTEVQHAPTAPDLPDAAGLLATLSSFMREDPALHGLSPAMRDRTLMAAERGRLRLLFSGEPEKALADLREAIRLAPRYPQPRNNLSMALFYNGQPAEAAGTLEATLHDLGPNVYALATLAFVRWAAGGAAADGWLLLCKAEAALGPESRLLDRTRLAEVAGVLGDHALAYRVLAAGETQPLPLEGITVQTAALRLRATALANLGRTEEALAELRATTPPPGDAFPGRLAAAVAAGTMLPPAGGGGYPYLRWDDLLSVHPLRRLLGSSGRRVPWAVASAPPDVVAARLPKLYPRLATAGALLLWTGEPALETLGLTLLTLADTAECSAVLTAHLSGTLGSYAGRQEAGYLLLDAGHLANGSTVPFWNGSAWTDLQLFRLAPRGRNLAALCDTLRKGLDRSTDAPAA